MNLLFENWRKFLVEQTTNSFASYNVEKFFSSDKRNHHGVTGVKVLADEYYDDYEVLSGSEKAGFDQTLKKLLEKLFSQIPPLSNYKIVKIAGVGTQGVVFLMSSGRIVKIFLAGYLGNLNSASEELEFYDKEQASFFDKQGTSNALYVISKGTVKTTMPDSPWLELRDGELSYAEMVRLMPLEEYLSKDGRDVVAIGESLMSILMASNYKGVDRYTYQDYLIDQRNDDSTTDSDKSFTEGEFNGIVKMIKNIENKYGPTHTNDLHAGNVGVTLNTIGDNEPTFVLFDP